MPRPYLRRDADDDDFDDPRPRRRNRRPSPTGIHPGLIIGAVAVFLLFIIGAAVAVWLVVRDRPGEPARNPPLAAAAAIGPAAPPPPDEAGVQFNIEINPPVRTESGKWQRLTPAGHPVTALAPGAPRPIDPSKLSLTHLGGPYQKSRGWEAKGTANHYYLLELDWRPNGNETAPDPKEVKDAMMPYLGLGGFSEPTVAVTIDGLRGQQYEPLKGYGFSGVFAYRSVAVRDRVFVFGVNSRLEDPAVTKFFDSIKIARAADGTPAGLTPPSPIGVPGLIAYLSFDDDPPDGRAMEAVSKTPVGEPVGQVGRVRGVRGKALDLSDGKSSFALSDLAATTTARGKSLTVSVWFKTDAADGTVFFAGMKPKNRFAPFPHLELGLIAKSGKDDREYAGLRWVPDPTVKAREAMILSQERLTGVWTHLAFTRDGKTGAGNFYVNGVRASRGLGDGMIGTIGGPDAILGGLSPAPPRRNDPNLQDTKTRQPFAGLIDELAIFDSALSEEDVRKLAGR